MNKKVFIIIFTLISLLALRVLIDEYRNYSKGINFLKNGKLVEAVSYLSYSVDAYLPFSPITSKSLSLLSEIGKKLYQRNELYRAMYAYENLRSALLGTRSFFIPHKKLVEDLDYKLSDIKVKILIEQNKCSDYNTCFKNQLTILQSYKKDISTVWSFISCFSFLLWIGAILFMILKEFEKEKPNKKIILISALCYIIFFSIWIVSLYIA